MITSEGGGHTTRSHTLQKSEMKLKQKLNIRYYKYNISIIYIL